MAIPGQMQGQGQGQGMGAGAAPASPLFSAGGGASPGVAPNAGGSDILQMLMMMRALQQAGAAPGSRGNMLGGKPTQPAPPPSTPQAPPPTGMVPPPSMG